MDATLEFKDVSKTIKGEKILKNVSFTINKGEIFGIAGPNGAGKTTMMKMLLGLSKLDKGEILLFGQSIIDSRTKTLERIGAMVEEPAFYKFFSGEQNLRYFASMHANNDVAKLDDILDIVGLTNSKHKKFKKYSMGMKQRLGIANSLLHNPDLLILDEPTNTLDPIAKMEFRKFIQNLSSQYGISILLSSHDLQDIEAVCNRYALLSHGEVHSIHTIENSDPVSEWITLLIEIDGPIQGSEILNDDIEKVLVLDPNRIQITIKKEVYSKVLSNLHSSHINVKQVTQVTEGVESNYYRTFNKG